MSWPVALILAVTTARSSASLAMIAVARLIIDMGTLLWFPRCLWRVSGWARPRVYLRAMKPCNTKATRRPFSPTYHMSSKIIEINTGMDVRRAGTHNLPSLSAVMPSAKAATIPTDETIGRRQCVYLYDGVEFQTKALRYRGNGWLPTAKFRSMSVHSVTKA